MNLPIDRRSEVKDYYETPESWREPSCVTNGHGMTEDPNDPTSSHCTPCGRTADEIMNLERRIHHG
jgi:hypothetical protein